MSTATPQTAALAFAAHLDRLLAETHDEALEHALVHEVGELIGGLSVHGFQRDLQAHLDRLEAEMLDEPGDYRLAQIDWALDDAAMDFLVEAATMLGRVTLTVREAA